MNQTPETVVKIGVEGGSLTLTRARSRAGDWQFLVTEDEGTLLDFLSEEERGKFGDGLSELGPVSTWEEALVLLDRHLWTQWYPLVVHEDFRATVWTAVVERQRAQEKDAEPWWQTISMNRWRSLCFPQEG
ncbi:MAG: hypothetical protein IMZ50_08355 [Candidatus Atribacteria bacterium]|nr:hypothetical protein [Candidatus Atribacteria bacterium]